MIDLGPDATWLDMPEADVLRGIAGGLLAVALLVAVLALAVGATSWALHRLGVTTNRETGLPMIGRALLASLSLAALSGITSYLASLF